MVCLKKKVDIKRLEFMNLIDTLKEARKNKWSLGQFNFSTADQLQGIAMAAKEMNTPVICGTSEGESSFFGIEEAVAMVRAIEKKEKTKLFLNFYHGKDVNILKKAVDSGYDMVHFDGSGLPIDENIELTKEVVFYARRKNVLVEGELGQILGSSAMHLKGPKQSTLTSIEKVVKFVEQTGVDGVALDVGNVHGIYEEMPSLRLDRVSELLSFVECFVALHGGSGVSREDIKNAILKGVVKININTELRCAWRKSLEQALEKEGEVAPYKILFPAKEAVKEKVKEKINIFKSCPK